jgi:imidazolonepropionase-like amidohydrolase
MWNPKFNPQLKSLTPDDFATFKSHFSSTIKMVGAMRMAKIRLLAGTDTAPGAFGLPFVYPGFSLHDELGLLVSAGFTKMEALQFATRNPAEYFGVLDSLGTVERGKIADLVLLEANPLLDIRNTQSIAAVVLNGRLLDRRALDALLAQAETSARKM